MIKTQNDLIQYYTELTEIISPANLLESTVDKIALLEQSTRNQELLVPVVGAFSSGKSTLINAILGEDKLPVGITPETSLATELRYSEDEYIEAIKEDGNVTRFEVNEIKTLTDDAAEYMYACLYLNNKHLKDIEPLVLVDMPGFNSPLDAHNKAIMTYIDRGCHYLVLASVEEGTISKSLLRHLREIIELGRSFSFLLTKTDLKSQSDIDSLVMHFDEMLRDYFDYNEKVLPVTHTSPTEVVNLLKNINANYIFFGLYRSAIRDLADALVDAINIKISSLKKDKRLLSDTVEELESTIRKLQGQTEEAIDGLDRRYAGSIIINALISDLGMALENAVDELVNIAKTGNMGAVESCITEIVRTELNIAVNNRLGMVNQEIISDLSESLRGLDKMMCDLEISDEFTQKVARTIQAQFTNLNIFQTASLGGSVETVVTDKTMNNTTKHTSMGTWLKGVAKPLLGILLAFLPEIIGAIFRKLNASQIEEKLRDAFLGQIFPQIKAKIRPELQKHLVSTVHSMIEQARVQYETQINEKKSELEFAMKERDMGLAESQQIVFQLEAVREEVTDLTNKLLLEYN